MKELTPSEVVPATMQSSRPVLIDFYSAQCPPCRSLVPVLNELSSEMGELLSFYKFDVASDDYKIASEHNVKSVPTIMVFRDGAVIGQRTGIAAKSELRRWIFDLLA